MNEHSAAGHVSVDELDLDTSLPVRIVFAAAGFAALGLGIAGTVVPGLPGFLFLLLALYLFSRSNERMYRWMLTNKYFGQSLRDYKGGLGIPRRVKVIAVTSIVVAVALSVALAIEAMWWRVALVGLGVYGIGFILSRPTTETELSRRTAGVA